MSDDDRRPNGSSLSDDVGSLARDLFETEDALLSVEARLEQLIDSLYGAADWEEFEHDRQLWMLDVYGCTPSPAAVDALFRAGFQRVVEHTHPRRNFVLCACGVRIPPR